MGSCVRCGNAVETFLLDELVLDDVTITPIGQRCISCSFVYAPSNDELMPVKP